MFDKFLDYVFCSEKYAPRFVLIPEASN